ncbi:pentapeptide repeat-containing protein [Nocardia suismassiliense]|uniref:pentapeptide repeat-containing protein n=1 Tax=Nocardia suismassiliense TaxID=2077092 RepID=UPI000D1F6C51|nr:pentapeptide repeat-containing protein [Nocardia suismassiliense]
MFGWVRNKSTALLARIGKSNRAIRRRAERFGLLPAIMSALVAGVAVAYVAYQGVNRYTPTSDAKAAPLDITKVALTIVAGVGGVVALVIAYRRQRDAEQSRFVERFGAAAAQLGATDVAVRIAGVYAMAGAADETDGLRRQQCIDVLCGYLRLPYTPDLGGNHQTKNIRKYPPADESGPEDEQHFEYRQNDREVRKTIVRVIGEHLRPEAEYSWSASHFDLRTAYLENVDFSGAVFVGAARFDEATFRGDTWFHTAKFNADNGFNGATFTGDTWFNGATFSGTAMFDGASFGGDAGFIGASFVGAARFGTATFTGDAQFNTAMFGGDAWFHTATFARRAWFSGAMFSGTARFDGTTFRADTGFGEATFRGGAWFNKVTFNGSTGFREATFGAKASFDEATFGGDTSFHTATFQGPADFTRLVFTAPTSFVSVDFGSERIEFTNPQRWGPPPPEFDWGQDGAGKPGNIEPHDWPPAVNAR